MGTGQSYPDDVDAPDVALVGMSGTVEESYPKEVFADVEVRGIVSNDVPAWIGEVASGQADASFANPRRARP